MGFVFGKSKETREFKPACQPPKTETWEKNLPSPFCISRESQGPGASLLAGCQHWGVVLIQCPELLSPVQAQTAAHVPMWFSADPGLVQDDSSLFRSLSKGARLTWKSLSLIEELA